jgi:hypothetical protein
MNFRTHKIGYQRNHSIISSYPINYYKYPLAKNSKLIEMELNENEYIFIPSNWLHWVFTEPYNLSMNYFINKIKSYDKNLFLEEIKKNQPFKNKIKNEINFSFRNFIKENLEKKFSITMSTHSHTVPVIKPGFNSSDFRINLTIKESLNPDYNNYYKYIAQYPINESYLNNLNNFIDVADNLDYDANTWINFDKPINSGLHFDENDNILINFIGKKKVILGHPENLKYLYFQELPQIDSK